MARLTRRAFGGSIAAVAGFAGTATAQQATVESIEYLNCTSIRIAGSGSVSVRANTVHFHESGRDYREENFDVELPAVIGEEDTGNSDITATVIHSASVHVGTERLADRENPQYDRCISRIEEQYQCWQRNEIETQTEDPASVGNESNGDGTATAGDPEPSDESEPDPEPVSNGSSGTLGEENESNASGGSVWVSNDSDDANTTDAVESSDSPLSGFTSALGIVGAALGSSVAARRLRD